MITPGFAEPVQGAQACFRAVLEAMSRPGRIQHLAAGLAPPAGLDPATAAVLLTLADAETPLHHDAGEAAEAWLRFHCGSPAAAPDEASLVLATRSLPSLAALQAGSEEEPERGATLVLQVGALHAGLGWRLSGPGIEREHQLLVEGLDPAFLPQWQARRALFPRGVDVIFCAGQDIAALPRTTLAKEG